MTVSDDLPDDLPDDLSDDLPDETPDDAPDEVASTVDAAVGDAVRDAVTAGRDADDVARRVGAHDAVRRAAVRPGVVKTWPPVVELDVDYATPDGSTASRVYDLEQEVDGTLRLLGDHAPSGDAPVTPP